MTAERQEELRERLQALGFDEVRFASAAEVGGAEILHEWLRDGLHADMDWMRRTEDKRVNPEHVLAGVKTVILLGVNYWRAQEPRTAAGPQWARYALHDDYHDTIKPGLIAAGRLLEQRYGLTAQQYRYYVDAGPVLERGWAARAGIGFLGKNAMLISRRHGNWLLLAAILTRLELRADEPIGKRLAAAVSRPGPGSQQGVPAASGSPAASSAPADSPPTARADAVGLLCGKCTRCLDACPTKAFARPGLVDARRCISYHTIENRGIIPRALRPGIGRRIYGCDVCLDVCPWNRFAREGRQMLLVARDELGQLTLPELLTLTPARYATLFRRTPIKRVKLPGLLRNACIVAANTGDATVLPLVVALAAHPSPVVRAHAVWAVHRLAGAEAAAARLRSAREVESDPWVLAEYQAESA